MENRHPHNNYRNNTQQRIIAIASRNNQARDPPHPPPRPSPSPSPLLPCRRSLQVQLLQATALLPAGDCKNRRDILAIHSHSTRIALALILRLHTAQQHCTSINVQVLNIPILPFTLPYTLPLTLSLQALTQININTPAPFRPLINVANPQQALHMIATWRLDLILDITKVKRIVMPEIMTPVLASILGSMKLDYSLTPLIIRVKKHC